MSVVDLEGAHWMLVDSTTVKVPSDGVGGAQTAIAGGHLEQTPAYTVLAIEVIAVDVATRTATLYYSDKTTSFFTLSIPAGISVPFTLNLGRRGMGVKSVAASGRHGLGAATSNANMKFRVWYRRA